MWCLDDRQNDAISRERNTQSERAGLGREDKLDIGNNDLEVQANIVKLIFVFSGQLEITMGRSLGQNFRLGNYPYQAGFEVTILSYM